MKLFIESCCTSLESAVRAWRSGAGRIELCEKLPVGGVTPNLELTGAVIKAVEIPVNVLIRPREGDFVFSEAEVGEMMESIERCRDLGAAGVVIGALRADGSVDMDTMRRLVAAARSGRGMSVTFHRAFDVSADPARAFEDIINLGCDRLLTSGHEATAYEGRHFIGELVRKSAGRIVVMAGCGVRPSNIEAIVSASSAPEYHSSCFWD